MSVNIKINNAKKEYGDFVALNNVSIDIKENEFFTLLGPSGCGKTTLLRMISGFNSIDGGEIYFNDLLINKIDAHKRDIGMVFQNYAIFPHLTVEENVAYGLKARKVPTDEIKRRTQEALELVQISHLAKRKPNELSGGQQQRVALARAFVIEPSVLLMDEPLSNLDAKLRVQMRTIIKKLQQKLGITTVYVTHDQEEALSISDRIAVMKDGNIMQIGTPKEIYAKPDNKFVAGFIGISNFIDVDVKGNVITIDGFNIKANLKSNYSGKAILSARPEQIFFADKGINGKVSFVTFLGDYVEYEVTVSNGQVLIVNEYTKDNNRHYKVNDEVKLSFDENSISIFDEKGDHTL